jgi:hypothetical protein
LKYFLYRVIIGSMKKKTNGVAVVEKDWQPSIRRNYQGEAKRAANARGMLLSRWLEEAISEKLKREAKRP